MSNYCLICGEWVRPLTPAVTVEAGWFTERVLEFYPLHMHATDLDSDTPSRAKTEPLERKPEAAKELE